MPPLGAALENGKVLFAQQLITSGATVDVYHPKVQGNLTLLLCLHQWKSLVFLLRAGAETRSLFDEAVSNECLEKHKTLLTAAMQERRMRAAARHSSSKTSKSDHRKEESIYDAGSPSQRDVIEQLDYIPFSHFLLAARSVMSRSPFQVSIGQALLRILLHSPTVTPPPEVLAFIDDVSDRHRIVELTTNARPLAHLCRCVIRQCLGVQRLQRVGDASDVTSQELGLPPLLINYLQFSELYDLK